MSWKTDWVDVISVVRLYHLAESIQKKLISTQLPPSMIRSGALMTPSPPVILHKAYLFGTIWTTWSSVGWPVNELEKLGDSLVSRFALCSCKGKKYSQFISLFSLRKVRKCWNNQKLVWILLASLPVLPPDWCFGPDQNYILCCDIFTIVLPSICFIPTLNRFIPFTLESWLNTYMDERYSEQYFVS